ncbi:MAG: propionyl-CoA synthetase [Deltaproteobacteria bacterium]|nr:propionyl-CoA synthetase [Deltaproteobacteria bacterium]MBW2692763.1 propionyl-CoA synthetase [Deltaproteobacteria bacterium]
MTDSYDDAYRQSLENPQRFWAIASQDIEWVRRPRAVIDDSTPPKIRWFPGAVLNTCFNAVDLHVLAGRGDQAALIYDSPVTGTARSFSYSELQDEISRTAGALASLGVERGDRVLLYMPMIPEAVIGMLATARLGAIHSVVFGGFAASELAQRIQHSEPKVILTASCGIEPGRVVSYLPLLESALEKVSMKPAHCVVVNRPEQTVTLRAGRDLDWEEITQSAKPHPCVPVQASEPLYILYTSGTTGTPKGVVRDNGGHAVALKWSMQNIYAMKAGDVFWAASDIGWVVGHSYIVYAPLLMGCTTVLYEGKPVGTPDASAFWRVISEHRVNALFTAPTAMRAIKREDPAAELTQNFDLSSLRALFLAGERADSDTVAWCERALGVPVIDHWWQTETGWAIAANCMGLTPLPIKRGSPTKPVPGYDVHVLDDEGREVGPGETGHIVIKRPLPPGCLSTLWNNDAGFERAYLDRFPGYYQTADAGHFDEDGYLWVMGRTDDVINVAGHRLSTGAIEEVIAHHPDVAECAVIGVKDSIKGELPLAFLVLNAGVDADPEILVTDVVARVREQIGPVAAFKQACVVAQLPKTRSGKILRGTMRKIADSEAYRTPATIDNPGSLDEIRSALEALGYAKPS